MFYLVLEGYLCFILMLPQSTIVRNEGIPSKKKGFLNFRAIKSRQKVMVGSDVLTRQSNREPVGRSYGENEGLTGR